MFPVPVPADPSDPGGTAGAGPDAVAARHLMDLARAGHSDQLAAHLDDGVPVDLTDPKGNTLLMLAAYHGRADTVRVLVERRADPDRANDRGQTPLAGAVFKGHAAVVEVLLAAGADPYAGTPNAHDTATFFGQADILALIREAQDNQ